MDVDTMIESKPQLIGDAVLRTAGSQKKTADQALRFYRTEPHKHFDGTDGKGLETNKRQHLEEVRGIASTILDTLEMTRKYDQPRKKQQMNEQVKFNHHRAKALHPGFDVFPHCAGYISWSLKVHAYDVGCAISNEQNVVVMLAHFYELARKHGLVTDVWHDLDFIVLQHSNKKPLITKTNDNADPHAVLRHFLIDLGVEVSAFSGRKQPTIPSDKVIAARGKVIRTSSGSELLAEAGRQFKEDEQRGHERANAFDIALTVLTENSESKKTPSKRKRHAKKQRFSTTQLLSTLKTHLVADEPNINFNYFGFTEVCLELLKLAVDAGCEGQNVSTPNTYRARLYWLMETAADAEAQSKPISATPFAQAAAEMERLVQKDGKRFSQEAYRMSSGTISEEFRPGFVGDLPNISASLTTLKEENHRISVGSSRSTIEIYDPAGSAENFNDLLRSALLDDLLVDDDSELVETFLPTAVTEYFEPSRPSITHFHNGRALRDNGETLQAARMMLGLEPLQF